MEEKSKPKILLLIKTMDIGGAEKFTCNICLSLKNKFAITLYSSGGFFNSELKKLNLKIYESQYAQPKNLLNLIRLRNELKEMIINNHYDVIHCQHRIFVPLLHSITGLKNILYTAHNYFDDFYQKLIYPDFAVAVSPEIKRNLLSTMLIKKQNIHQINYGVDCNVEPVINSDTFNIGFTGRLIKEKGIYQLIESVKTLHKEFNFIRLIIRGKGTEENNILRKIETENLSEFINVLPVSIENNSIYSNIDLLVLPSELNEGLPISILEACARKILVITTKVGAVTDLIKDNITGFLIVKNTPKYIEDKIKYVILKKDDFQMIKENAYKKILSEYSLSVMLEKYESLYKNIAAGNRI